MNSIASLVAAWKNLQCAPPFLKANLYFKLTLKSTTDQASRTGLLLVCMSVFFLNCSRSFRLISFNLFQMQKSFQSACPDYTCLYFGCKIKVSHSKEARCFRTLLKRWNIDLLFLTGTTTKEKLVPREDVGLRSVQYNALRSTVLLHMWRYACCTMKCCLVVWRKQTHAILETCFHC